MLIKVSILFVNPYVNSEMISSPVLFSVYACAGADISSIKSVSIYNKMLNFKVSLI